MNLPKLSCVFVMSISARDDFKRMITIVEMQVAGPKVVDIIFSKDVFVEDVMVGEVLRDHSIVIKPNFV